MLLNGEYNDLGILIKDRLMLFVEAQSTWNDNMPIRILFYLAETYRRHLAESKIDPLHEGHVTIPAPEAYVIFTGNREEMPCEARLSDHFPKEELEGVPQKNSLELNVKMVYNGEEGDIVSQYIAFCRVFDEQRVLHSDDRDRAITETLRICRARDCLADFLGRHEPEVYRIMSENLSDFFIKLHIESEKGIAWENGVLQGAHDKALETAKNLLGEGIPASTVAKCTGLTLDEVMKLQAEMANI